MDETADFTMRMTVALFALAAAWAWAAPAYPFVCTSLVPEGNAHQNLAAYVECMKDRGDKEDFESVCAYFYAAYILNSAHDLKGVSEVLPSLGRLCSRGPKKECNKVTDQFRDYHLNPGIACEGSD